MGSRCDLDGMVPADLSGPVICTRPLSWAFLVRPLGFEPENLRIKRA